MANRTFTVKHNLDQLSKEELAKYLMEVSIFIGLDPDLNGLDTIWMNNETSAGRSLVVYARRGTAEILRNIYGVEVESLTYAQINSSIVFTATGRAKARDNRQEIAIGAKSIVGLNGKELDDSIMTASTRALRRLTMQFTTLGILDESEIVALLGHAPNPAGSVQLAPNPTPPVFAVPQTPANNAPGKAMVELERKPIEAPKYPSVPPSATASVTSSTFPGDVETEIGLPARKQFTGQQSAIDEAWKQQADKKADMEKPQTEGTPAVAVSSPDVKPAKEPAKKRTRRARNTVSLEVEPEVVSASADIKPKSPNADIETIFTKPENFQVPAPPPVPAPAAPVTQVPSAQPVAAIAGLPSKEQLAEYREKIGVYTRELPPSQDLDATKKMRAFMTHLTGTRPQDMTVEQYEKVVKFFSDFMTRNSMKNLVKYINDSLGVK